MSVKVIARRKLPKRHYTLAAECRIDFDDVVTRLEASVEKGTFRDGLTFPKRYRYLCLQLSTGRFATLTQTEMDPATVEIGLEIHDDEFFHSADLLEIMRALEIQEKKVSRMQGDFTWISAVPRPSVR